MHDKRYYWLKLEENYFDLKVQKALRKLPSGADMLICYLKMQLKYLNTGGLIEFNNICQTIVEEIALDIDEEEDLVKMTLAVLIKWNVIEEENDGLFISEMQERIGSKSDSAIRVAKHREKQKTLQCNNDVTKCNPIKEIDIEKEIDIDNISSSKNKIFDWFNERNINLNPIDYETINKIISDYDEQKINEALEIAKDRQIYKPNYVLGILVKGIKNTKKITNTPEWVGKDIKSEEMSNEELTELEDMFKEIL